MGQSIGTYAKDDNFVVGAAVGAAVGTTVVAAGLYMHASKHCPYWGSKIKQTGLKEYSVVYSDRAVNLMSNPFQQCMKDISSALKEVYNAEATVLIPGSGTYGMEAVARQFGMGKTCLVLRHGYFSFRWTDIFNRCRIPSKEIVLKARPTEQDANPNFAPLPIEEVVAQILAERPALVCSAHVETSTGIIMPDDYIKAVAAAVHKVGGLFVLDCIASGTIWADMKALDVDVLITAPQKGWSGPACVGIVMLGPRAKAAMQESGPEFGGSFCCNLNKWAEVMDKYEAGAFMYYTTLPTDGLMKFNDVIRETRAYGFQRVRDDAIELGRRMRAVLEARGFKSVSPTGWQSPGVIVSYTSDPNLVAAFKQQEIQIAGGVPFMLDEPKGLITFRLGLFGLDKLQNIDKTVRIFEKALDVVMKNIK